MFNAINYLNNNYFSRSYFFTVDFTEDLDAAFLAVDFLAEVLACLLYTSDAADE